MSSAGEPSGVSGIVLAAGASSRFGGDRPKQLLEHDGESFLRRAAKTALAARLNEVLVILGHAADDVARALDGLDVRTLRNPDHRQGQSTSVRRGIAGIDAKSRAAIFIPADQPLLTSALIDRLVTTYLETGARIVVPTHGGKRGAPVLFDRRLFFELERLEGDTGGRAVLPRYESEIVEVPVGDPLELADIDREADLRRLPTAAASPRDKSGDSAT